jgi:hypothetical protein
MRRYETLELETKREREKCGCRVQKRIERERVDINWGRIDGGV